MYYGSLASAGVAEGQTLEAADRIGVVGYASAEPYIHLHLAIKEKDHYVDPGNALNACR